MPGPSAISQILEDHHNSHPTTSFLDFSSTVSSFANSVSQSFFQGLSQAWEGLLSPNPSIEHLSNHDGPVEQIGGYQRRGASSLFGPESDDVKRSGKKVNSRTSSSSNISDSKNQNQILNQKSNFKKPGPNDSDINKTQSHSNTNTIPNSKSQTSKASRPPPSTGPTVVTSCSMVPDPESKTGHSIMCRTKPKIVADDPSIKISNTHFHNPEISLTQPVSISPQFIEIQRKYGRSALYHNLTDLKLFKKPGRLIETGEKAEPAFIIMDKIKKGVKEMFKDQIEERIGLMNKKFLGGSGAGDTGAEKEGGPVDNLLDIDGVEVVDVGIHSVKIVDHDETINRIEDDTSNYGNRDSENINLNGSGSTHQHPHFAPNFLHPEETSKPLSKEKLQQLKDHVPGAKFDALFSVHFWKLKVKPNAKYMGPPLDASENSEGAPPPPPPELVFEIIQKNKNSKLLDNILNHLRTPDDPLKNDNTHIGSEGRDDYQHSIRVSGLSWDVFHEDITGDLIDNLADDAMHDGEDLVAKEKMGFL